MRSGLLRAGAVAALLAVASAAAQEPPPAPTVGLRGAKVRQGGADLLIGWRLTRPIPAGEPKPRDGRSVCMYLGPGSSLSRRVCLRGAGKRLTATVAVVRKDGSSISTRPLPRARIEVEGGYVLVHAAARDLQLRLGRKFAYQARLSWHDGGPCEAVPGACDQQLPKRSLRTRVPGAAPFAPRRHLKVLATGDSMIQIVDSFLQQKLATRGGRVISEAHISSGISKPGFLGLNWVSHAAAQARNIHPDVTVMFLGPNEGFPMKWKGRTVNCCGRSWTLAYAARARDMMRSYRRKGRSLVYWLTLPATRRPNFKRVFRAVNLGIRRAGRSFPSGVRVIDMGRIFTPRGTFQQTVCYRGHCFSARQSDGIHLSTEGAKVAADVLVRQLRRDRAIR